jgi:hypothetical protein
MSDLALRLKASQNAQSAVQDLLAAGQDVIKHGNALFNDIHDGAAFRSAARANIRATEALITLWKITEAFDE